MTGEESYTCWVSFCAKNLAKKDFFGWGCGDPYLTVLLETVSLTKKIYLETIATTEYVYKTSNPEWKPLKIAFPGYNSELLFEVYDKDTFSRDDFIGSFKTTLETLCNVIINCADDQFPLQPKDPNNDEESGEVLLNFLTNSEEEALTMARESNEGKCEIADKVRKAAEKVMERAKKAMEKPCNAKEVNLTNSEEEEALTMESERNEGKCGIADNVRKAAEKAMEKPCNAKEVNSDANAKELEKLRSEIEDNLRKAGETVIQAKKAIVKSRNVKEVNSDTNAKEFQKLGRKLQEIIKKLYAKEVHSDVKELEKVRKEIVEVTNKLIDFM